MVQKKSLGQTEKGVYKQLTFKKFLHSPWSTGPSLLPSNSTNLIPVPDLLATSSLSLSKSTSASLSPSLSLAIHLISASGASTKHVKWSSVSSFGAVWLSFEDADSVWTLAKRGVEERISARSKGVLSFCNVESKIEHGKEKGMCLKTSYIPWHSMMYFCKELIGENVAPDWIANKQYQFRDERRKRGFTNICESMYKSYSPACIWNLIKSIRNSATFYKQLTVCLTQKIVLSNIGWPSVAILASSRLRFSSASSSIGKRRTRALTGPGIIKRSYTEWYNKNDLREIRIKKRETTHFIIQTIHIFKMRLRRNQTDFFSPLQQNMIYIFLMRTSRCDVPSWIPLKSNQDSFRQLQERVVNAKNTEVEMGTRTFSLDDWIYALLGYSPKGSICLQMCFPSQQV